MTSPASTSSVFRNVFARVSNASASSTAPSTAHEWRNLPQRPSQPETSSPDKPKEPSKNLPTAPPDHPQDEEA
jgi:hypothetical protein